MARSRSVPLVGPIERYEEALSRWEEFRELWAEIPHPEYCRRIEATLRDWLARGVPCRLVALRLEEYLAWCEERGEDPVEARALPANIESKLKLIPSSTRRSRSASDELTPTQKLKRRPIAEKYAEEIEALYAG